MRTKLPNGPVYGYGELMHDVLINRHKWKDRILIHLRAGKLWEPPTKQDSFTERGLDDTFARANPPRSWLGTL